MKKLFTLFIAVICIIAFGTIGTVQADLLGLSLVMDGSGSISPTDWNLQLNGYANAIMDSTVVSQDSTIAINVIQFSNSAFEEVGFTLIDSQATANSLASQILGITQMNELTCISCGIDLGSSSLLAYGFGDRMVIDVTTDGFWNLGIDPLTSAMNAVNVDDIDAVNSLGIGVAATFNYGVDSFNSTVSNFAEFGDAIKLKIQRETNSVPEPGTLLLLGSGLVGLVGYRRKRMST